MAKDKQREDERKARARYIDQPGQWIDTTPENVKKKQEKAWAKLFAMMEQDKKSAQGKKKGKK